MDWLMWKRFSVPQKYEGGGIQRLLVSVPLSVVCACVCLHCPQMGSDDSTMLTSQDALTFKTFIPSLPASWVVRHKACQPQMALVDQEDSGQQTDKQVAHQHCLRTLVWGGMGMPPKTTLRGSSSRAPSSHIRAAELFELSAIVPGQMGVFD